MKKEKSILLRRAAAYVIDIFASLLTMVVFVIPLVSYNKTWWPLIFVGFVAAPLYLLFADGFYGAGIGKRMMGLRVIDAKTKQYISFTQSFKRAPTFFLSGSLVEGVFTVANKNHQSLSDRVTQTRVVLKKDIKK